MSRRNWQYRNSFIFFVWRCYIFDYDGRRRLVFPAARPRPLLPSEMNTILKGLSFLSYLLGSLLAANGLRFSCDGIGALVEKIVIRITACLADVWSFCCAARWNNKPRGTFSFLFFWGKRRIVPESRAHVRIGSESLGVEPPGRLAQSGSRPSDGLRSASRAGKFGWHWRLFEKAPAGFPVGRPSAGDAPFLPDIRAIRRRGRNRRRRAASGHAIDQSGFRQDTAHRRRHFRRELPPHWVLRLLFLFLICYTT